MDEVTLKLLVFGFIFIAFTIFVAYKAAQQEDEEKRKNQRDGHVPGSIGRDQSPSH
jgi:large-conductance mechanosensitive channel